MHYSLSSKLIHWLMSIMLISMLIIGFSMTYITFFQQKSYIYHLHQSIGLILMILIIVRIAMRTFVKYPKLNHNHITAKYAKFNVIGMYLMMIIMPLSGVIMSIKYGISFFGIVNFSNIYFDIYITKVFHSIHKICSYIFTLFIITHICGGLFHHFILKDNILKKML